MSQDIDSGYKTFIAGGAIGLYDRVKISAAKTVAQAGLAERDIGVAYNEAFAAGELVRVKLASAPGTTKCRVSEALAVGAVLYTESTGEVQDTAQATAYMFGIALEAATAADDIIEAVRLTSYTAVP